MLVEGQVEVQMLVQRSGWVERECSLVSAQLAEARVGPSSRVRMWVSRMSGWRAAMPLWTTVVVVGGGSIVEQAMTDDET